jgi:DNA-binding CsgD family transcriptional regulator/tetratricopeptide (TPR) repeat protein
VDVERQTRSKGPSAVIGAHARTRRMRGREGELAELERLIARAHEGEGGVAVIEGAPGIGKSRLLAEAGGLAARRGLMVATGVADELDRITPWGALLGALTSTNPMIVSREDLMALSGLLDGRLEVLERIRMGLEHAAREQPLVLVIDDLQWADLSTLLALGSLTGQLFSYPIVWLLGRRPFPTSPQMEALMVRVMAQGGARLELGPLDAGACTSLAEDLLGHRSDPGMDRLVGRAEGNPLYIVEILRDADARRGDGASTVDPDAQVVRSLASVVLDHLRSLSEDARRLVKVASVLGQRLSVVELAAITGQPTSELLMPLGETLAADVLVEDGEQLSFVHDLFRRAVYDDVPAPVRLALHRDAAAALATVGAPVLRIASHLAIGAVPGDDEAIETLGGAASDLFGNSPSAAADLALRIVQLLGDEDPRRPGWVAAAVQMLGWSGRLQDARALGETYLADHDLPVALQAQIQLGMRRAWLMHTGVPYPTTLPPHLVTDDAISPAVRADLIVVDQNPAILARPASEVTPMLDRAAELVKIDGDATDLAFVQSIRLGLEQEQGNLLAALTIAQAPLAGFPMPPDRAVAIRDSNIASCLATLGRPAQALGILADALRAASSSGQTIIVARCHSIRAMVLLELGRVDDARAEAHAAADLADSLGFGYYLGQALVTVVETSLHQGDLEAARAAANMLAERSPHEPMGDAPWAAALCADATGQAGRARATLEPIAERLAQSRFVIVDWYPARLPHLVGVALRSGARDQAAVAAGAATEIARRNPGVASAAGSAFHAQGLVASDPELVRAAVQIFAGGDRALATAAAREDLGRLLAERHARDEAIEQLDAAYDAYVTAGASRDTARVRAILRPLGVRKRQVSAGRPDRGWESLTKSERLVVDLVARGLTNREAATELFLSPDTINAHLKHAFAKLNIRSRVQLARLAAEREHERQRLPEPSRPIR